MFRTFFWYFILIICLIISLPCWLVALLLKGEDRKNWIQKTADFLVPIVINAAGFKVETSGKENIPDGPALFVGNHQGLFDMMVAFTEFNGIKPFLAKIEASKIPIVNSWMRMIGCVFIDREDIRASLASIKECEDLLKSGNSLIIFPEGTRSRKHEMNEFKPGAFRCAIRAGVPIVPFVLDGTYKAWEENHKIVPTKATLKFLPPIETTEMEKERTKHISDEVYEEIKKALG